MSGRLMIQLHYIFIDSGGQHGLRRWIVTLCIDVGDYPGEICGQITIVRPISPIEMHQGGRHDEVVREEFSVYFKASIM